MFVRQAAVEDAELVLDILNSEIAGVDPDHGSYGIDIARLMIESPGDPSTAWLFSEDEESVPFGTGNLQPDLAAERLRPIISVRFGDPRYPDLLDWFIAEAQSEYPSFRIQIGVNKKNTAYLADAASRGFEVLRYYNTLRAPVGSALELPQMPQGVQVRNVDLANLEDLRSLHMVHQSSFAENFGFVPRDFDSWLKRVQSDKSIPSDGIFLLDVDGITQGFIWLDDIDAFDLRGFVVYLGVTKGHRSKGYGQILLGVALARFSRLGYRYAELGVDTENSSNALRVYEKMGFSVLSTEVELDRPVSNN